MKQDRYFVACDVKKMLADASYTQAAMAELLHVAQQSVSRWCRDGKMPRVVYEYWTLLQKIKNERKERKEKATHG